MAQIKYNLGNVCTKAYSTNETVIGTWIDGKPIYRKVIELNNITVSTNWVDTGVVIQDIQIITDCSLWRVGWNTNIGSVCITIRENDKHLMLQTHVTLSNVNAIAIDYTKTTD